jgi:hypothetical protein
VSVYVCSCTKLQVKYSHLQKINLKYFSQNYFRDLTVNTRNNNNNNNNNNKNNNNSNNNNEHSHYSPMGPRGLRVVKAFRFRDIGT